MIESFFFPKTIAVIGATANPKKFGNAVTSNILKNKNLKSEVFLITPTNGEILGNPCYKSLCDVPKDIDLAIILVPAKIVEKVVDDCIEKKVKGIIIVTAGFGEIDEAGKKVEEKIAQKCKDAGIRVIGPNCVGIQNVDIGLNASFIQPPPPGNISMISQSGSFGCGVFYAMEKEGIGCSKFANLGNMCDVSFKEILQFYRDDPNSEIICIYMETVSDGRGFFNELKNITPHKPVVVLKGGVTGTGMKAASSHTGSVATNFEILKASIKQTGGILCENVDDFITVLKSYSSLPLPKGERVAVLTNSGGSSVLFSDEAEKYNIKFASFSENLIEKIKPNLISIVKYVNPLDMIAGAGENEYYKVTKAMLEDPEIDAVVPCCVIPPFLEMSPIEHYRGIIRAWNETGRKKPIMPLMFLGDNFKDLHALAKEENAPVFYTPHEAAFALKAGIDRMKRFNSKHLD